MSTQNNAPNEGQSEMPEAGVQMPEPATSGNTNIPEEDKPSEGASDTIQRLEAEISKLRAENSKARVNAKTQAAEDARKNLIQELGKTLGLVKDGDRAPTPEQLTKDLTEEREKGSTAQLQLTIFRAAPKHGADGDALLDSASFLSAVKGLDPTDSEKIGQAIKAAVDANPRYRVAQAAARTSAEFNGGTGEQRNTPHNLTDAIAQHYGTNK